MHSYRVQLQVALLVIYRSGEQLINVEEREKSFQP